MSRPSSIVSFAKAPTQFISAGGIRFAYRELGPPGDVPVLMLNHWGANLDNFDPCIVEGLACRHRVITVNYRGIGASTGIAPVTVGDMARDTIVLIRAMGLTKVDLFGFSLGGFVAQEVAVREPGLVRKLVLTGTGPAGGDGIARVGRVSWPLMLKGLLTLRDPKFYLFFTPTNDGRRAARAFLRRLKERKTARDKGLTPHAFTRQLQAIKAWGQQPAHDLSRLQMPVLIANGDNDIMVPTPLSHEMAHRLPNAQLLIYANAGHGSAFQYHADFVSKALTFLSA